jgi:hypothetical protein
MFYSKLLTKLYDCGTTISVQNKKEVQLSMLDKIASLVEKSETLTISRDASVEDIKTLAIAAVTKDMETIMQALPPMAAPPPKITGKHYFAEAMYGEKHSLDQFIFLTEFEINAVETKRAKLNAEDAKRERKLEFEAEMTKAKVRLAFVEEVALRKEWTRKIKNFAVNPPSALTPALTLKQQLQCFTFDA